MNMDIKFKIDVATLLTRNSRATLEKYIPELLHKYETMEVIYGKELAHG